METVTNLSIPKEIKKTTSQKMNKQQINLKIIWNVTNNQQIKKTKELLKDIINNLTPTVQVSIEVQENKAKTTNYDFAPTTKDKQQLLNFIDHIQPAGNHLSNASLLKAKNKLKAKSGSKHILIIADSYKLKKEISNQIINKINKANIKIHVIQVGVMDLKTKKRLKRLAKLSSGKYSTYSQAEGIVYTIKSN